MSILMECESKHRLNQENPLEKIHEWLKENEEPTDMGWFTDKVAKKHYP